MAREELKKVSVAKPVLTRVGGPHFRAKFKDVAVWGGAEWSGHYYFREFLMRIRVFSCFLRL